MYVYCISLTRVPKRFILKKTFCININNSTSMPYYENSEFASHAGDWNSSGLDKPIL